MFAIVMGLCQISSYRGRTAPLDILPVRLISLAGKGHADKLSPLESILKYVFDKLMSNGSIIRSVVGVEKLLGHGIKVLPLLLCEDG